MSDAYDRGIAVAEIATIDQPIDVCPPTMVAFVGRALRGPLNTPVLLQDFAEFQRRFGDVWSRSSLGPAVQQFFAHGGQQLYVVRIANHARGAMLVLPADGSALVLRALEPGSSERIRASVDYDGIDDADDEHFNLTLQRMSPATGYVLDQEFLRNVSWRQESSRFVGDELLTSSIARLDQPYATHRPDRTLKPGSDWEMTWVEHAQAGADGVELSDYDVIGSRNRRTGIFALEQIERFDLLYVPPPGKGVDVGPAAMLVADRYCRERNAMLVVDPPAEWDTAEAAVSGVRSLGYDSPNMLGYFPRLQVRGDEVPRPAGAAIAGLLCKQDQGFGIWTDLDRHEIGLRRDLRPAIAVDEEDERLLHRNGLNAIVRAPRDRSRISGNVTLGRGSQSERSFLRLPTRRFCLQLVGSISRATRWAVFEQQSSDLAARIRGQVLTYFECLNDLGAFASDHWVVQCDAGVSHRRDEQEHGITILLLFQPAGCSEPISMTLHQTASGCRVGSTAFGLTLHA